ncbi:GNAT family N-acetyltransferase [Streptomyces sp. HF10]|uniref:GNAT family N-acetyltransferase n=1 Tax=Streptomyces sp. HF10 TaxID=2692233 RepID=UPI0013198AFF|nr:GNAT family protein [Streptomyces sp. HF10]QHC33108.1 GNAT family N-acetyltransferase [Streptomyces sp. HF10]
MVTPGKRVALRALEPEDADVVFAWFQEDYFRDMFGYRYPVGRGGWRDWIDRHGKPSYHDATFMLYSTEDGAALGLGALRNPGSEDRSAEVSLALGDISSRGLGLGREAALLMAEFGFHVMGLRRIYAWVLAQNLPAAAACQAAGAVQEGIARKARLVNGTPVDAVLYGVLAEEFAERMRVLHRQSDTSQV